MLLSITIISFLFITNLYSSVSVDIYHNFYNPTPNLTANTNFYQDSNKNDGSFGISLFYDLGYNIHIGASLDIFNKQTYDYYGYYSYPEDKLTGNIKGKVEYLYLSYSINKLGSINIRYKVYSDKYWQFFLGSFVSFYNSGIKVNNLMSIDEMFIHVITTIEETNYTRDNNLPSDFIGNYDELCQSGYTVSDNYSVATHPVTGRMFILNGTLNCFNSNTSYMSGIENSQYEENKKVEKRLVYLGVDITLIYSLTHNFGVGSSFGFSTNSVVSINNFIDSDMFVDIHNNSHYLNFFLRYNF